MKQNLEICDGFIMTDINKKKKVCTTLFITGVKAWDMLDSDIPQLCFLGLFDKLKQ